MRWGQDQRRYRVAGVLAATVKVGLVAAWVLLAGDGDRVTSAAADRPTSALLRLTPEGGWERLPAIQGVPRDRDPDISSKGAIAFAADRSGRFEIWVADPGQAPNAVTAFHGPRVGSPRWAPDGRRIALVREVDGVPALFILDRATGRARRVAADPGSTDRAPAWSRDGQRLYFASNRLGGWRIWITRPPYEEAMPITAEGWLAAKESADGRWLYMVRAGDGGLWRQVVDGGPAEPVAPVPAAADSESWLPSRDGIYLLDRPAAGPPRLLLLPADGGAMRLVAPVPGAVGQSGLTLDLQGRPVIAADLP